MGKRNELKQIVRKIKRTYKTYLEKSNDETTSLVQILSFFNIPLDESRLADYRIENISFQKPTIVVIDEGTNNIYNSEYVYNENTTNLLDCNKNYIRVTINNTLFKIISFYRLPFFEDEERHIRTSVILKNDEFALYFIKEGSHRLDSSNELLLPGFIIRYARILENESDLENQVLLTKVYKEYDKNSSGRAYNLVYNYSNDNAVNDGDEQVTYDIIGSYDIQYFINKMEIKDENGQISNFLLGFCFDNLIDRSFKNIPFPSYLDKLNGNDRQELHDTNTRAAVYLKGGKPTERWCEFKIYKKSHQIQVTYSVKVEKQDSEEKSSTGNCLNIFDYGVLFDNKQTVCADFLKLPVLTSDEGFSIEEIDSIIETLNSRYEGDEFIRLVIIQLLAFRHKICINRGLENENDLLAPKKFVQMSIPEIVKDVIENKEAYFALAEKQFQESNNIDDSNDIKKLRRIQ